MKQGILTGCHTLRLPAAGFEPVGRGQLDGVFGQHPGQAGDYVLKILAGIDAEATAASIRISGRGAFADLPSNDCSVIFLALKLDAMLISGDKALRKAGKDRQIEVHGTLWIFDQLVDRKLLPSGIAASKLEHLRCLDRFFPEADCQIRLKRWQE